jgi:hypothetical protein
LSAEPTRQAETIPQWCLRHNYSITTFYKLKKRGQAPEILVLPGATSPRITQRADLQWEARMLHLAKQESGRREAERRRAQRIAAAKVGVERGTHPSTAKKIARLAREAAERDSAG